MNRLEFSPAARDDLLEIARHIAADDPKRALSFVDELAARCAGLRDFPEKGRSRAELAPNLRSMPHGRYVIFYTPFADLVRIERIIHGARDVEANFARDE